MSIPDGSTYDPAKANPNGDIIQGIRWVYEIIKSDRPNRKLKKWQALAVLIHFIGDIQQPLHVGRKEDKGGNAIRVNWFGRSASLHRVWDSAIIARLNMNYRELARALDKPGNIKDKWFGKSVVEWADEGVALRSQVYKFEQDFSSVTIASLSPMNFLVDEHNHGSVMEEELIGSRPNLGRRYLAKNLGTVKKRLLMGGVRIAEVLNIIFK